MRKYLKEKWKEAIIFCVACMSFCAAGAFALQAIETAVSGGTFWSAVCSLLIACPLLTIGVLLSDYLEKKVGSCE